MTNEFEYARRQLAKISEHPKEDFTQALENFFISYKSKFYPTIDDWQIQTLHEVPRPVFAVEARDRWEKKIEEDIFGLQERIAQLEAKEISTPKIVLIEEMDMETAKNKVGEYMKKHKRANLEELMAKLGIEIRLLISVLDEFKKEGKIRDVGEG